MYCSHCGSLTADDVSFCKNCGYRTMPEHVVDDSGLRKLALISGGAIGVVGLMAFYPLLRELLRSPVSPDTMVIVLVAYLLTVGLMFTVLVRHEIGRAHV